MESIPKGASARRGYSNDEEDENKNEDDVMDVRTIRDAVFGIPRTRTMNGGNNLRLTKIYSNASPSKDLTIPWPISLGK